MERLGRGDVAGRLVLIRGGGVTGSPTAFRPRHVAGFDRLVDLGSAALNVVVEGQGPLVVLMHGWSYDLHLCDSLMLALHDLSLRTVRYDQRGHGGSPSGPAYQFQEIAAPTLVVYGESDVFFPPSLRARIAESMPGAQLAVIGDAEHGACTDQPSAFNRAVSESLVRRGIADDRSLHTQQQGSSDESR